MRRIRKAAGWRAWWALLIGVGAWLFAGVRASNEPSEAPRPLTLSERVVQSARLEPWFGPDDRIIVRLEQGRLVIDGEVGTLSEKTRLNALAFEQGADWIENRVQARLGDPLHGLPYFARNSTPLNRESDYQDRYVIDPAGSDVRPDTQPPGGSLAGQAGDERSPPEPPKAE